MLGLATVMAAAAVPLILGLWPPLYYMIWVVVPPMLTAVWWAAWLPRRRRHDAWGLASTLVWAGTLVAVCNAVPLRVGFALVRPVLESRIAANPSAEPGRLGIYRVGAATGDYCGTPGIEVYPLGPQGHDHGAFVHAPMGIDELCYNSGEAGWLWGDWYWKVDD